MKQKKKINIKFETGKKKNFHIRRIFNDDQSHKMQKKNISIIKFFMILLLLLIYNH